MKATISLCYLIVISTILYSCTERKKYPHEVSDFSPGLRDNLVILSKEKSFGFNDSASMHYLATRATREELIKATAINKPLLRLMAYRSLVKRKDSACFNILLQHLSDTASVVWWPADDYSVNRHVADIMLIEARRLRLMDDKKALLAHKIITQNQYLDHYYWILEEIKPQARYYTYVKKSAAIKAELCHQNRAIYALAKYNKHEDLQLIGNFLRSSPIECIAFTFKTIEAFPDSSFLHKLTDFYDKKRISRFDIDDDDIRLYCRALAAYRNKKSLAILTLIATDKPFINGGFMENKRHVFEAIHKHKSPLYKGLEARLRPQMEDHVIEYLDKPSYSDLTYW